jgi:adenylate kinase family enzyme
MHRISVIGVSGSGKTTFAAALAARLGLPYVDMDALHWQPNWAMVELDHFRARVVAVAAGDAWVTDGNYGKARDCLWPRAEAVVWLDYHWSVIAPRLLRRELRLILTGQEIHNGNRVTLRSQVFSRDSLFLFAFHQYRRHRPQIEAALAQPENAHLKLFRFRSPRASRAWLDGLKGLRPDGPGHRAPVASPLPTTRCARCAAREGQSLP